MPTLTSLIFVGYAALTFNATSPEQAQIEVEPGYWNWSHQTTLANIPFSEENTECLPPSQSRFSLDRLAADLGQDCSVTDVESQGSGYSFTLVCEGFYSGEAQGTLRKLSDYQIQLEASGQVMLAGLAADFSFDANANHVGQCPQE